MSDLNVGHASPFLLFLTILSNAGELLKNARIYCSKFVWNFFLWLNEIKAIKILKLQLC